MSLTQRADLSGIKARVLVRDEKSKEYLAIISSFIIRTWYCFVGAQPWLSKQLHETDSLLFLLLSRTYIRLVS